MQAIFAWLGLKIDRNVHGSQETDSLTVIGFEGNLFFIISNKYGLLKTN